MSNRKDGAWVKREKLKAIAKTIAPSMPSDIKVSKVLLGIEYNLGLSRKKAEEYLSLVLAAHEWMEKDGRIVPAK